MTSTTPQEAIRAAERLRDTAASPALVAYWQEVIDRVRARQQRGR